MSTTAQKKPVLIVGGLTAAIRAPLLGIGEQLLRLRYHWRPAGFSALGVAIYHRTLWYRRIVPWVLTSLPLLTLLRV